MESLLAFGLRNFAEFIATEGAMATVVDYFFFRAKTFADSMGITLDGRMRYAARDRMQAGSHRPHSRECFVKLILC